MAWSFGDSFDLYAAPADMITGYWDSAGTPASAQFKTGRFSVGQSITTGTGLNLVKSSNVNDAVHHFVVSFQQTVAISGSTLGLYFELFDGATAQCSVVFRTDGAILLTSGGPAGTVLATYTGAFPVQNTWYAFEFEVVINNTTGSFTVRKNGNNVADFTATGLNTRGGTANNYANKVQFSSQALVGNSQNIDDFFWQSGAATGTWLGDIRCYARMPASDVQKQFTPLSGTTNFSQVSEAHQDGLTSYVFDSNPGDADFYGVASIASTPAVVIATVTRAYMQKSDAGTRTAAVQLKSGATTVASPTLVLTTSGWLWAWRMDLTDPNTGAAWTPAAVNNAQIGPKVIA
jgi:hypothetical protein